MTSEYIATESNIIALAKAIRGAVDVDDAIAKARDAGFPVTKIEQHLDEALTREFMRVCMGLSEIAHENA
jgi:hypothetical protein